MPLRRSSSNKHYDTLAYGTKPALYSLERFRAKWTPVRVKKTPENKNLVPRFDSIKTEEALG
jgi:hypothetical protein